MKKIQDEMRNNVPSGTKKKMVFLLRKNNQYEMRNDVPSSTKNKVGFYCEKKKSRTNDERRAIGYKIEN